MTLISPSGQVALSFGSHSTSSRSQSISSLPPGLSSLTSATVESDGYFSEIDVFDNEDTTDCTSETIKTLFSAPLASNLPLTFSSSKIPNLPCPTPVRPQRANSSPQMPSTTIKRSSLKVSSSSYCYIWITLTVYVQLIQYIFVYNTSLFLAFESF